VARKRPARRIDPRKRAEILAAADKLGLTADQVERRFGVSKWTYYAWRKRLARHRTRGSRSAARGAAIRRIRRPGAPPRAAGSPRTPALDLGATVRAILPHLIAEELSRAFAEILRRRPRPRLPQRGRTRGIPPRRKRRRPR